MGAFKFLSPIAMLMSGGSSGPKPLPAPASQTTTFNNTSEPTANPAKQPNMAAASLMNEQQPKRKSLLGAV